ncbi:MAG: PDZ domain-containing protein, partial [Coriobacteriia bacterium]|nr:PDZ domain-containing protein [Coriobacteriia bacterium]
MIEAVEKGSPAERGGLQAGMVVKSVNGHALRDVLDWFWLADGQSVELLVSSSQSSRPLQLAMRRQPFEPWGLGFT